MLPSRQAPPPPPRSQERGLQRKLPKSKSMDFWSKPKKERPPRPPPPKGRLLYSSAPCTPSNEMLLIDFSSPKSDYSSSVFKPPVPSKPSVTSEVDLLGSIDEDLPYTISSGASTFYNCSKSHGAASFGSTFGSVSDPFEMLAKRTQADSVVVSKPLSTLPKVQVNTSKVSCTPLKPKTEFRPTIIRAKMPSSGTSCSDGKCLQSSLDYSFRNNVSHSGVSKFTSGTYSSLTSELDDPDGPLPPRPETEGQCSDNPHAVAEFDYDSGQPGDLSFKAGETIQLLYRLNEDWLFGRCSTQEGMFPESFVKVVVSLEGDVVAKFVTALYTFNAEQPGDLSVIEGTKVKVLGKVNEDWLYGEVDGIKGQFPSSFIDQVPEGLPLHLN